MSDHWTIADELRLCPRCGKELDHKTLKCFNKRCPVGRKNREERKGKK